MSGPVPHFWSSIEHRFNFRQVYTDLLSTFEGRSVEWTEVGVFHGASVCFLAVEAFNRDIPITIHAVDPFYGWSGTLRNADLKASCLANLARLPNRSSVIVHDAPSTDVALTIPDGSQDVVWLDGDHDEGPVYQDCQAWWSKVKPGGWLGGDDYIMPWLAKSVQRFAREQKVEVTKVSGRENDVGQEWPSWLIRKPLTSP